ncbi:MAG TPA: tetratricopeptide repeat protein [Xanthomonadaceae bacterium]|nr:tetratricopeptide repeat protein [Xanthomonadaceae bacterium]
METIAFVVAALALAALVALVVTRPLWRATRGAAVAIGTGLVVCAGLLYLLVGTPASLDPATRAAPASMADAIAQLEAELARSPRQVEGWRLLGRAQRARGRVEEAADAFARAARLLPDDPDVLVEAAEARAMANPRRTLDAQAVAWLDHALEVQPAHQRARWFRGIAHRQAGDPAAAARTWEPLLAMVEPSTAASLREQVELARAEAGLPPLPDAPAPVADGPRIEVTVSLAAALADRMPPGATLYVIARQAGGPPIPVAVERMPARDFPVAVILDDADSLMPTTRLSQAGTVEVSARVSASGDATAAPGDLESAPVTATPGTPVAVSIDRVVE